jgi:hypothetical protein
MLVRQLAGQPAGKPTNVGGFFPLAMDINALVYIEHFLFNKSVVISTGNIPQSI